MADEDQGEEQDVPMPDPEEMEAVEERMMDKTKQSMEWDAVCPHCGAEFLFSEAFERGFRCPECGDPVSADGARPEFQDS